MGGKKKAQRRAVAPGIQEPSRVQASVGEAKTEETPPVQVKPLEIPKEPQTSAGINRKPVDSITNTSAEIGGLENPAFAESAVIGYPYPTESTDAGSLKGLKVLAPKGNQTQVPTSPAPSSPTGSLSRQKVPVSSPGAKETVTPRIDSPLDLNPARGGDSPDSAPVPSSSSAPLAIDLNINKRSSNIGGAPTLSNLSTARSPGSVPHIPTPSPRIMATGAAPPSPVDSVPPTQISINGKPTKDSRIGQTGTSPHGSPGAFQNEASLNIRLDMSVVPGRSIGPFSLGATIGDIIHSLREMEHVIPQVECKYGDLNPLDIDIVLNLPLNGMCMRFDPYSQRLKSIEVYDFNKLLLFYSNQEFNSFKVLPTFVHIYKLFGPIYPGEFCKEKKQYVLSYPGISFMFPIPDKYIPLSNVTDLPLSFPDGTTPVLNRLYVFTGADRWQDACPNAPTSPVLSPALMADSSPSAKSPVHATSSPVLAHAHRGVQLPSRSSTSGSVLLLFGTPAQDVLDALGKPDRIMEKEEQRMRIFGGSSSPPHQNGSTANGSSGIGGLGGISTGDEGSEEEGAYFWNYFSLGIDILFSEATHSIVKFVLHTNQTGSWDFCVYRKCHFTVLIDTESPTAPTSTRSASGQNGSPSLESAIEISCDQPWADIQPLLQSSAMAAADTRPVVFSRGNGHSHPFGSTWFYGSGVGGCVFEVMRNGYLASVTLFS